MTLSGYTGQIGVAHDHVQNGILGSIAMICPDIRYTPLELAIDMWSRKGRLEHVDAPSYHWLVALTCFNSCKACPENGDNQMSELNLLSVVLIYYQFCHKPIVLIS